MKIKTEQLKELVNKASKGVGDNKLIPITQLMGIKKTGNDIVLTTTDATNYLYVHGKVDTKKDDIQVTVFAEQFAKLISKITSEFVTLELKNDTLEVVGNGTYTLELPLDENGEVITYPDPLNEYDKEIVYDEGITLEDINVLSDSISPSLATTLEMPAITNYYIGDTVVATDRYKIASYNTKLLSKDVLMSAHLVELLDVFTQNVDVCIGDECIVFHSDDCEIYTKYTDSVSEYPIDVINTLIGEDYTSMCKVSKAEFIALLERIALFVGKYDDKAVRLYFEKNGITVSNKNRKSSENLDYIDSKKFKAYDCVINVDMLLTQLKAYASDSVEIHYNNEHCIKFVDGDVVQIIALMEE